MKKLTSFILLLLFSSILISCAQSTQTPMTSVEMIGPGDKIGDMPVVQGHNISLSLLSTDMALL